MDKRLRVKIRNVFKPITSLLYEKPKLTSEERLIVGITKQYINDPTSKLRIAPLSGCRYIENEKERVLIKLAENKIVLYYKGNKFVEDTCSSITDDLIKHFNITAENSRILLEQKFLNPIMDGIKILKNRNFIHV